LGLTFEACFAANFFAPRCAAFLPIAALAIAARMIGIGIEIYILISTKIVILVSHFKNSRNNTAICIFAL
jgi:hypothetical protein